MRYNNILFFVLFLLLTNFGFSQESGKRSSLKKSRLNFASYQIALDSANYFIKKDPKKSILFVEEALNATANKQKTAQAYVVLADAFFQLKQYDLAQSNYKTAYTELPKSISLELKLASAYFKTANYTASKELYTKILNNSK